MASLTTDRYEEIIKLLNNYIDETKTNCNKLNESLLSIDSVNSSDSDIKNESAIVRGRIEMILKELDNVENIKNALSEELNDIQSVFSDLFNDEV